MRTIDQLRKHEELGGEWRYDGDAREWVRADGLRVYRRAHMSMCCMDACDHYHIRYWAECDGVAREVHGLSRGPMFGVFA